VLLAALSAACAPRGLALPAGDGQAFPDFSPAFVQATAGCRAVRTLSAELAITGRVGGGNLRGRATVGLAAPGRIRLEGIAPFGPPVFVLVADGASAMLLLPRDNRVVRDTSPAAILEALVGIELGPDELLAILAGCVAPDPQATGAHRFSGGWARVDLASGGAVFLQQDRQQAWRLRAGVRPRMTVEYDLGAGPVPAVARVRFDPDGATAAGLRIAVAQADINVPLGADVFAVKVPPDARAMSVTELRNAGPLGAKR
jgi:hypothetical protein